MQSCNMKNILITGIGGFVGHHAAEHLLKNTDWKIVGIDSWRHKGDSLRLRHLVQEPQFRDRLKIITHDLRSPISQRMIEEIGSVDIVLNIASSSHVDRSIEDPVPFVEGNVSIALNVGEYCRAVKPKMLIQCSTDEVFGPALEGEAHTEWLPNKPSNPYAASKAAQNSILFSYWRCYDVPLVITHCMNMIGERQDPEKFIPMCISKIFKGEEITIHGTPSSVGSRMYLHSRNLADAWLFLMKNVIPTRYHDDHSIHQQPDSFNIVGDEEVDNLTMAQKIAEFVGKPLNYRFVDFHKARPGHDRRYALDGSKIAALGWKAPVPLWESIQKTVDWTLKEENRIWMK